MPPILRKLEGGDRRSIGRLEEIVSDILKNPALSRDLIAGLSATDAIARMRVSDAMEKISLVHPEYLWPYKAFLIQQAAISDQKEVRWYLVQVLPRLNLNQKERQQVVDTLLSY